MYGSNLRGTDLRGTDLRGTNMRGTDLRGTDMRGTIMRGTDLYGADLRGTDLRGTDLYGADLRGTIMRGANLSGDKLKRLIAHLTRIEDPYEFFAFELESGGVKVLAGCRWFTLAEYRAHVATDYPGTPKAEETLAILAYIETQAKALGQLEVRAKSLGSDDYGRGITEAVSTIRAALANTHEGDAG
jgi:uncharacterized protein YjbI with pentapeptide repeats